MSTAWVVATMAWAALAQVGAQPDAAGGNRYNLPGADPLAEAAAAFQEAEAPTTAEPVEPTPGAITTDTAPSYRQSPPAYSPPPAPFGGAPLGVREPEPAAPLPPSSLAAPGASAAAGATPRSAAPEVKPAQVLAPLLQAPASGTLGGTPISLGAALSGATTRTAQTQHARAYWELSISTAEYYLALRDDETLRQMAERVAAPSERWLDALAAQQTRVAATRRAAETAQLLLQRLLGPEMSSSAPLAADAPHAGRYETRYSEIFAGRPNPTAQRLHELLPLTYESLQSEAGAIAAAAVDLESLAARGAAVSADQVLASFEMLSLRRRQFLTVLLNYNLQIADYTELATPDLVASERLVAMLISNRPATTPQVTRDEAVRATAFIEPADASAAEGWGSASPQTAAATAPREVRRPILRALRDREHSILVRPFARFRDRD